MTPDEIIALAKEIGEYNETAYETWVSFDIKELVAFYNLARAKERENWPAEMKAMENQVNILTDSLGEAMWAYGEAIEKEREACAKIADEWSVGYPHPSKIIAAAIRARKETV